MNKSHDLLQQNSFVVAKHMLGVQKLDILRSSKWALYIILVRTPSLNEGAYRMLTIISLLVSAKWPNIV